MKQLMTGNEAIARGAFEAGVVFCSAYPGTPSTEILENISTYKEIYSEWAPNEKVALEAVIGAAIAGGRAMASMKHVGVNVAADPLFTVAYTGINGGMVLVTADEPGQHSSQNEQDNRNIAPFAKIPMLEPASSQECKDMIKIAFEVSEQFDTPVLVRMTTRVCHSKGIVECLPRTEVPIKDYVKDVAKYMTVPANSRLMRVKVEKRTNDLTEYSEKSPLNFATYADTKIGVISSGLCHYYAKEVFGDDVSYLKLGFTYPYPTKLIKEFCEKVDKIYIIEENDPIIENVVKILGFSPIGKDVLPPYGEMTPDVIRKAIYGETLPVAPCDESDVYPRPPILCAGCPHRGIFFELGKLKDVMIAGDIGCYTLGFAPPYNAMDFNMCMGASISAGHGAQKVFDMKEGCNTRVISVIGDSTFFHTGVNSLLDVVYNQSKTITVIMDNRITGMTGHQENPGTGFTAMGTDSPITEIEPLVTACGIKNMRVVNPNDITATREAIKWAMSLDEPSVIITRWPCVLKKFSERDKADFPGAFTAKFSVDSAKCVGCKMCLKCGCPALSLDSETKKATIDKAQCVGCSVCAQICPVKAISEGVK